MDLCAKATHPQVEGQAMDKLDLAAEGPSPGTQIKITQVRSQATGSLSQSQCPTPTPGLSSPLCKLLTKDQPLKITMKCYHDVEANNDIWEIESKAIYPRLEGVTVKREHTDSPASPEMLHDQRIM